MRERLLRRTLPLLLALVVGSAVPAAWADDAPDVADGPRRLARYTACASGLAVATTLTQAYTALVVCVQVILAELPNV